MNRVLHNVLVALLSAALLIAQHGAMAHVLSHFGIDQPPAREKTLAHSKLCDKCVSAEKLSHCAPNSALIADSLCRGNAQPYTHLYTCQSIQSRKYDSRGPPRLL